MRKVLWSVLMVLVLASTSWAALPEHTGFVTDVPGILSVSQHEALEQQLRTYEAQTSNELAVAIVSGLDGYATIEEYGNALFHKWGIGKKDKDNGILFLWDPMDRKIRIEVGYGLEPALPDGRAGQIIREEIAPRFKAEQYAEGVFAGVAAIREAVAARDVFHPAPTQNTAMSVTWILFLILITAIPIGVGIMVFTNRERRRREEEEDRLRRIRYINQKWDVPFVKQRTPVTTEKARYAPVRRTADNEIETAAVVTATQTRKKSDDDDDSYSRRSSRSSGYDSSSSWSSSSSYDSGSSFGGGDSGGGGASGDY